MRSIEVFQVDHGIALVSIAFAAGEDTRLAPNASRWIDEELHVGWNRHRLSFLIPMTCQTGCAPALRIKCYKFSSLLFTLTAHTLYSGILEIGSCADIVNWLTLRRPGQ